MNDAQKLEEFLSSSNKLSLKARVVEKRIFKLEILALIHFI
jgi:hypothetical protein